MKYAKKVLPILGIALALTMTACGSTTGNAGSDTSSTESQEISSDVDSQADGNYSDDASSTAENSDDKDAETEDSDEEKGDPDAYLADDAVKDSTYDIRANAKKGSTSTLSGKYEVKDSDGVYYIFTDGKCNYVQIGTYSFENGTDVNGDQSDMILIKPDNLSTPSYYTIAANDDSTVLTTTEAGAQTETTQTLTLAAGDDGISSMKLFEGIYYSEGSDIFRYEFHKDGTYYMLLDEECEVKDGKVTLTAFGNSFTYNFKESDGNMVLTGDDGTEAVTLIPVD